MNKVDSVSMKLARDLDRIVGKSHLSSPEETMAELEAVERRFLNDQLSSDVAIEIRRRVAEWKFKIAVERRFSKQQIEPLHAAVTALGFSDLETDATIEMYYAQFQADDRDVDGARQTVEALRGRAQEASARQSVTHIERDIDSFLNKLQK